MRHTISAAVLALATLSACGSATPGAASGPELARTVRSAPDLSGRYALLRTTPEAIPATTRRVLRLPIAGLRWDLTQRVPAAVPGAYWLIPARRYICLVAHAPATTTVGTVCATTAQATQYGIANTTVNQRTRTRLIVGVAPDGARMAIVHTHGDVARVPVRAGIFIVRDATLAPADRVTLR
jgi:hypothetical protein